MEFIDGARPGLAVPGAGHGEQARTRASRRRVARRLLGGAVADAAYFSRSPGATADGPLDAMEVDGLRFSFVGRPVADERCRGRHGDVDRQAPHDALRRGASDRRARLRRRDFATPAWSARATPTAMRSTRKRPATDGAVDCELTDDLARHSEPGQGRHAHDGSGFHGPLPIAQLESGAR